jgi:hypothetical protein
LIIYVRAFMEYIENTFKMCKETKCDTILQSKRAKEEKAHYQAKLGPKHVEKKGPKQTKRSPNGMKLYRHVPYMPNGPPGKDGGETVHPRCDCTPSGVSPAHLCYGSSINAR